MYAGKGRDFSDLRRTVDRSSVCKQVILMGHVQYEFVPVLVRQRTLLVAPTHLGSTEARPKTTIEAIVLGKTVIAPNLGPFPYLVEDGVNGLLFQPNSVMTCVRNSLSRCKMDHYSTRVNLAKRFWITLQLSYKC